MVPFILKLPRPESTIRGLFEKSFHDHEIFVYETILPRLNSLLEQPLSPARYYTAKNKTLILEDLSEYSEYRPEKSEDQLGYQHCAVALQTLAKLHASSFKFGQENPRLRTQMNEKFYLNDTSYLKYLLGTFVPHIRLTLKDENYPENHITEFLKMLEEGPFDMPDFANSDPFPFSVLAHGNFNTSNILFKYGPDGGPCGAKIIDFQTSAWATPAIDVVYFALTSMKMEISENNFDDLVKVYLRALNEKLSEMTLSDIAYSEEQFDADIRSSHFIKYFTFFLFGGGFVENIDGLKARHYAHNPSTKYSKERYNTVENATLRWFRQFQTVFFEKNLENSLK